MPPLDHLPVTRDDFRRLEQLIAALQVAVEGLTHAQDIQFTRIAQVQADIDVIRRPSAKLTAGSGTPPSPKSPTSPPYAGVERRLSARKK